MKKKKEKSLHLLEEISSLLTLLTAKLMMGYVAKNLSLIFLMIGAILGLIIRQLRAVEVETIKQRDYLIGNIFYRNDPENSELRVVEIKVPLHDLRNSFYFSFQLVNLVSGLNGGLENINIGFHNRFI